MDQNSSADQTRQTTVTQTTAPVERRDTRGLMTLVRIVWFITGIIVTFLLVRVVLALLGANLDNAFASFVYTMSDPFVVPFRGLLQVGEFQAGVSRLEVETLLAALVYYLVGWGITKALRIAK